MDRRLEASFPHHGWRWLRASDSAAEGLAYQQYPSCDYCGHLHLRYVHFLKSDHPPHTLMVGCDCAEILTSDNTNPKLAERELRNLAAKRKAALTRREKFPFRRWTMVAGNVHWITFDGVRIGVIPHDEGGYWLKIDGRLGKRIFPTLEEAKLHAFDVAQHRQKRQG